MHKALLVGFRRLQKVERFVQLLLFLGVTASFTACSSSVEITSNWTAHDLKVGENDNEWKEATTQLTRDVFLGVRNDKSNLYLCLITSNAQTQIQMLALGTYVWFDRSSSEQKTFGVQYPISGTVQVQRLPTRVSADGMQRLLEQVNRQMEILGPVRGEHHRFPAANDKGVSARMRYADGTLSYELKIPLHTTADQPYSVNIDTLKTMMIGLETGEMTDAMKSAQASQSQGSGGGGGRGGRGGGGGGRGGRGGQSAQQDDTANDAPAPLKYWITVHLASDAVPQTH